MVQLQYEFVDPTYGGVVLDTSHVLIPHKERSVVVNILYCQQNLVRGFILYSGIS